MDNSLKTEAEEEPSKDLQQVDYLKGYFTQNSESPLIITHPHAVPDVYGFISSGEYKWRFLER